LCLVVRDLCIFGVQGKLLAEGIMSTMRRMARVHYSMIDWTGTPSDVVCQRSGLDALNAEGHIVRRLGGRRCVLSAINAETARPQWPDVRLRLSAYVMSHKPRDSSGSLSEQGAWCNPRTRASTGPLPGRGLGIPCPRILGPGGDLSGPHTEGSGIFLGGPPVMHRVQCFPRGRPRPTACIRSTLFPLAAW
jgi:hypothetical protein